MRFEYADGRMPVAVTAGGATYYLAYDQVGSLKTVADASGTVVKNVGYDSFGNVISDSNPVFAVPFGFAGGLHDRDTGLVRFGYRDYDPDTGRWTAKDPILFAGGDTDLYGYCVGDPVDITDSDGLKIDWHKFFKYTNAFSATEKTKLMIKLEKIENFLMTQIVKKCGVPAGSGTTKLGPVGGGLIGAIIYMRIKG